MTYRAIRTFSALLTTLSGCALAHAPPSSAEPEPARAERAGPDVVRRAGPIAVAGACLALGCAAAHPAEPAAPAGASLVGAWERTPLGCAPGEQLVTVSLAEGGALERRFEMNDFDGTPMTDERWAGTWEPAGPGLIRMRWLEGEREREELAAAAIVDAEPFGGEGRWWATSGYVLADGAYRTAHYYGTTTVRFDRALDALGACRAAVETSVTSVSAGGAPLTGGERFEVGCEVTEDDRTPGLFAVHLAIDEAPVLSDDEPWLRNALRAARPSEHLRLDPAQPHVLLLPYADPMAEGYLEAALSDDPAGG